MTASRIGIWLLGARGGVATTTVLGLAALKRQSTTETGLVTALPMFQDVDFPSWVQFVVGGHEIRKGALVDSAWQLHHGSRVFAADMIRSCQSDLEEADANIRPGILWKVGSAIGEMAEETVHSNLSADECVTQVKHDLREFRDRHELSNVIVVNLASTEAMVEQSHWPATWVETEQLLQDPECPLPASSLYAIAAFDLGMPFINFTPSLGASPAGIDQLARLRNTCHAGRDAKTGETLLKSVLAPMFAARNLHIMSWVGHNIIGNLDGKVLDDPANKASKVRSKDQLLEEILGYAPQSHVSIEYMNSLGDWKTAWDHIHFQGFLQTPMVLQFTWQGCDSLLAAPLVLDLVRLVCEAVQRKHIGTLTFLSSFFKSPLNCEKTTFFEQIQDLGQWAMGSH